jgi:TRAP-type C4-dicarboxylate transport system substrate-binding protein
MKNKLNRRSLATIGVLSTTFFLLTACAPASVPAGNTAGTEADVITYRVATIEGINTPMNEGFERFVSEVAECSDGRLIGTNYPAGQLAGFVDLIDGNRQGTYEITSGGFDIEAGVAPIVSALSLGYIFKDEEHVERVISEMKDELNSQMDESTGVTILAMGEDGWRWTFSSKPINTVDDLLGVKIRVPESEIPLGVWGALGANPTPVPFTEIYNALETGVIDAGESALAQIDANAFWEPAQNLINSKHWFNIKPVRANSEWFKSLDADLQSCLTSVGESVFAEVRQESRTRETATLEKLAAAGVTVAAEPSDLPLWESRAEEYNAEYFAKYPGSKEFIDKVLALTE